MPAEDDRRAEYKDAYSQPCCLFFLLFNQSFHIPFFLSKVQYLSVLFFGSTSLIEVPISILFSNFALCKRCAFLSYRLQNVRF